MSMRIALASLALVATACAVSPPAASARPYTLAATSTQPLAVPYGQADVAVPVRLRVPAIGVDTRVIRLALDRKGKLIAPKRYDVAGWNVAGPEPGERGAAVVAGHVDSKTGPAVFYRLRALKPGNKIHVHRADGTRATFTVYRLARYSKARVPNAVVYGATRGPELRLITCGGTFDGRSYRDNVVVFAR